MKLSRREMAALAAGAAIAAKSEAQTPPAAGDIAKAVRDADRRNSAVLEKFEIPIGAEPAFQFRA
jgi:hypothetical protein